MIKYWLKAEIGQVSWQMLVQLKHLTAIHVKMNDIIFYIVHLYLYHFQWENNRLMSIKRKSKIV